MPYMQADVYYPEGEGSERIEGPALPRPYGIDLRVISYNVMYDGPDRDQRTMTIIQELQQRPVSIILLQEVHRSQVARLVQAFEPTHQIPRATISFIEREELGNLVLVPKELEVSISYYSLFRNSFMKRGMAVCLVGDTFIVSTHLESLQTTQFRQIREQQMEELWSHVARWVSNHHRVIIGMDSNQEDWVVPAPLQDVWADHPMVTWHASRFYGADVDRRYDRVLISGLRVQERQIHTWPHSDHDALEVVCLMAGESSILPDPTEGA